MHKDVFKFQIDFYFFIFFIFVLVGSCYVSPQVRTNALDTFLLFYNDLLIVSVSWSLFLFQILICQRRSEDMKGTPSKSTLPLALCWRMYWPL